MGNKLNLFHRILNYSVDRKGFKRIVLGVVPNKQRDEILLLTKYVNNKLPNIMFAAGFHGEEPAGIWGVLHFLRYAPKEYFEKVNLSFLPLVNPSGYRYNRRWNDWNEETNSHYHHSKGKTPAKEGRILLKNLEILKLLAKDCFITLHEDEDEKRYYVYTYERNEQPGKFTGMLKKSLSKYFPMLPDKKVGPDFIENGVGYMVCDHSFEDRLFHEGIERAACTETPGMLKPEIRTKANMDVIKSTIDYISRLSS